MDRLPGRVALVTGAAQGLGRSIALAYAREGAAVGVLDIQGAGARAVAGEIAASGGQALDAVIDVSQREQTQAGVRRVLEGFGRLDVLVNNAMWMRYGPVEDLNEESLDRMLDVGLKALVWMIQAALPAMRAAGRGSIINLASITGESGFARTSGYSAVKGGVIALTRALAVELGPVGIRVNAIAPGAIPTSMSAAVVDEAGWEVRRQRTPLGRIGTPEDVAAAAVFLASDESAFITGEVLHVDGGFAMASMIPQPPR